MTITRKNTFDSLQKFKYNEPMYIYKKNTAGLQSGQILEKRSSISLCSKGSRDRFSDIQNSMASLNRHAIGRLLGQNVLEDERAPMLSLK